MPYPKKFMTITELSEIGLPIRDLKCWVHIKDFPSMRVGKRGQWKINTDYLDAWLIKRRYMKMPSEEILKITSVLAEFETKASFIDELIELKKILESMRNK